uniref:Protein deacetylase HDAC6 n=1 Tax=Astyanax mexicanus TaxID=7994 RepID=A0A8B9LFR4_ASTMX
FFFSHPECPERVTAVVELMKKEGLLSRCVQVEVRNRKMTMTCLKEYIDRMRSTQKMTEEEMKLVSDGYDSVYLHPDTFSCACLAVGSVLQLVDKVMTSELRNGFSVSRPPGHHAQTDLMNGYCMFNNLAVAARYAQKQHGVQRVLIVDWDVHHGQGIQYIFQDDPKYAPQIYNTYVERATMTCCLPNCELTAIYIVGEMSASPQCFSVLTHMLMGLAQGRIVLALEGGYNLQATAEGACASLRSLLGDPCPHLPCPGSPSESALKSISKTVSDLYPFWTSLKAWSCSNSHLCVHCYSDHPERPQRIFRIFSRHEELGFVDRCQRIPARLATEEELALCHGLEHIATIKSTEQMKPRDLHKLGDEYNSIYISQESYKSALLAAGSCFNSAQAILTGQVRNGVAIVRPPGHHAERDKACGFCFFNTAALTARYAQSITHSALRVLILDWDVHHGNGTQHIFEEDDSVLYISLHRYEDGLFFPSSEDANYDKVGQGKGAGYNVNIPWNKATMGDPEYLAAFHNIVMPIAREFAPELVLVSAGFDAARGDPLGRYQVTPEGYAHLTHQLLSLAAGRVLVILEGGYNLNSISESMAMCTSMLLGDAPPMLPDLPPPHASAAVTINNVLRAHAPYWRSLRIQSKLYLCLKLFPESLRMSLPSPQPKTKRSSTGRSKKSPRQFTPAQSPSQQQQSSPVITSPASPAAAQEDSGLDELTQGLHSLDLSSSTSANSSPTSIPVGGARPKVKPSPQKDVTSALEESPVKVIESDRAESIVKAESTPIKEEKQDTMYVVDPLAWCPHLESVRPLPVGGIDVFRPCEECGADSENWVCLCCYKVLCGRFVKEHMVTHGQVSGHPMVLSFADLSVWCYPCESYVHNKVLHEIKNAAHVAKFGEEIPPIN